MFPISRFEFYKNQVIYFSVVKGNAYCSMHNRDGLTNEQAKGRFFLEHQKEVAFLLRQNEVNERGNSKLIVR